MPENDVKRSDVVFGHERSHRFFGESSIALEFLSPHFSKLNSVRPDRGYVDLCRFFQPVTLVRDLPTST